jgi:3',5'-cyclic-AMP phosphodiesterase
MRRRDFLATTVLGGISLAACLPASHNAGLPKKRMVRIAHITDMHLEPDTVAIRGANNLLQAIDQLDDQPDFILNTGDNIMDALKRSKSNVAKQWDTWRDHFRANVKLPLYNCIGNHDVWGWGLPDKLVEADPLYGKEWALKMLELRSRYYSVDLNGWKMICLDSPFQDEKRKGYTARLDDVQFDWLKETLASTPLETPIILASHIPILSPSVFFDGENESKGDWNIPGAWMHMDARRIKDLLIQYPNVKLAVSGHVHLVDQVKYLNVNYVCNGAASGGWWKGNYQEFPPAFALIDLYDDGSFDNKLIHYNWNSENKVS